MFNHDKQSKDTIDQEFIACTRPDTVAIKLTRVHNRILAGDPNIKLVFNKQLFNNNLAYRISQYSVKSVA